MTALAVSPAPRGTRRVMEIDPQVDPRWETFVAAHPDGLIYHHPAWLQVLEREYGHRPICLAYEDSDGSLQGVLPLYHTRGLPFNSTSETAGRRLSSLPRTPVAGVLSLGREVAATLVSAAVTRVRRDPGTRLQLKVSSAELDGLIEGLRRRPWRSTYVLELPKRPEELRFGNSRNHAGIKRAVNKAARLGVQVRPAETEGELRTWYELYLDTMRWHAVPPRPYRLFKATWELLRPRGLMRLLVAEQHEAGRSRLLAGSLFLMFGQTVFYAFGGRRRDTLSLRPNDAIHWRAIGDACRDGFRYYDFGEVAESSQGLARFKGKWGAERKLLYRYYYPAPPGLKTDTPASDGHGHPLVLAAWRRLPLKATAFLGDWLYRYL